MVTQLAKLHLVVPRSTSLKINWHCKVGKAGTVWMFKTSVSNPSFILFWGGAPQGVVEWVKDI